MSLQNRDACLSLPECDAVGGVLSAGSPPARLRLGLLQLWGFCGCQITTEPVLGPLLGLEMLFLLQELGTTLQGHPKTTAPRGWAGTAAVRGIPQLLLLPTSASSSSLGLNQKAFSSKSYLSPQEVREDGKQWE